MSIVQKVAKNSGIIFAGEIIVRILGFFVTLILVRYLGSGDFGKYSLVYAFLSFFQIFMGMGIDSIIIRELSKDEKKGALLLGNAITLKFFFSLIGLILCWITLQWLRYSLDIKLLIYVASLTMAFSFGTLFNTVFQAKLSMKYVTAITLIMKIALTLFTVLFIALKAKLFYFIFINLLIYVTQVVLIYYQSKKFLNVRIAMDLEIWKELLKNSWPLAISIIFMSIYTRIDQLMLFHMKGEEELGFYAAAVRLAELPVMIAGIFMTSVFPLLSEYAKTSPDSFKKTYELSFKYLMIFIIPIAMITTLYSKQIIFTCYGQSFLPSQVALAILIWSTIFVYAGIVHSNLLVATNSQRFDIIFTSFLVMLNICLNLILIPKYSFIGAAIATTISYGSFIPISYLLKKTHVFATAIIKSVFKPLFAALIAVYSVYFFLHLHLMFNLLLSGIIYLFLILFIRGIDSQDFRYSKEIFTKSIS